MNVYPKLPATFHARLLGVAGGIAAGGAGTIAMTKAAEARDTVGAYRASFGANAALLGATWVASGKLPSATPVMAGLKGVAIGSAMMFTVGTMGSAASLFLGDHDV